MHRGSPAKASGSWEIFVDDYRQGSITVYRDAYVAHLNDTAKSLTTIPIFIAIFIWHSNGNGAFSFLTFLAVALSSSVHSSDGVLPQSLEVILSA